MTQSKVDDKAFQEALKKVPDRLFAEWRQAFGELLLDFDARMQLQRLRGRPGLFRRTGTLARGFQTRVKGQTLDKLLGVYFTNVIYAKTHEYGAVIRPKKRRWLTIPTDAVKTPGGDVRGSARDFDLEFHQGKLGKFDKKGKFEAWFILKKQVYIPPRLGVRKEWQQFRPVVKHRLRLATQRALAGTPTAST